MTYPGARHKLFSDGEGQSEYLLTKLSLSSDLLLPIAIDNLRQKNKF
jgi:hypothetical protein